MQISLPEAETTFFDRKAPISVEVGTYCVQYSLGTGFS